MTDEYVGHTSGENVIRRQKRPEREIYRPKSMIARSSNKRAPERDDTRQSQKGDEQQQNAASKPPVPLPTSTRSEKGGGKDNQSKRGRPRNFKRRGGNRDAGSASGAQNDDWETQSNFSTTSSRSYRRRRSGTNSSAMSERPQSRQRQQEGNKGATICKKLYPTPMIAGDSTARSQHGDGASSSRGASHEPDTSFKRNQQQRSQRGRRNRHDSHQSQHSTVSQSSYRQDRTNSQWQDGVQSSYGEGRFQRNQRGGGRSSFRSERDPYESSTMPRRGRGRAQWTHHDGQPPPDNGRPPPYKNQRSGIRPRLESDRGAYSNRAMMRPRGSPSIRPRISNDRTYVENSVHGMTFYNSGSGYPDGKRETQWDYVRQFREERGPIRQPMQSTIRPPVRSPNAYYTPRHPAPSTVAQRERHVYEQQHVPEDPYATGTQQHAEEPPKETAPAVDYNALLQQAAMSFDWSKEAETWDEGGTTIGQLAPTPTSSTTASAPEVTVKTPYTEFTESEAISTSTPIDPMSSMSARIAPKIAYVPPQRRAQSEPTTKCSEDQMREWFEKMMMPAMEKRDAVIEQCLDEVKHSPRRDETAVNKLMERLSEQAHDYERALPKCLKYTIKNKLSYRMFTNLWHRCNKRLTEDSLTIATVWRLDVAERILRSGAEFYQQVMNTIVDTYKVDLAEFLWYESEEEERLERMSLIVRKERRDLNNDVTSDQRRAVTLLMRQCIQLGDIYRYIANVYKLRRAARERSSDDGDVSAPDDDEATEMDAAFARSRHMYRRANQLAPELGRPHNQLANLAQMQSRYLDAWYHYARACATKNPFDAAIDSLMELTTHIRRFALGYDVQVNKLIESIPTSEQQPAESDLALLVMTRAGCRRRQSRENGPPSKESKPRRTEFWLHPSGLDAEAMPDDDDRQGSSGDALCDVLCDAPMRTLHKRAFIYALHVCGIIYTKTGLDQVDHFIERALIALRTVVEAPKTPVSERQLVMLVTCAICCVNRAVRQTEAIKDCADYANNFLPQQLRCAVRFALSLWAMLLSTLDTCLKQDEENLFTLLSGATDENWTRCRRLKHVRSVLRALPALALFSSWISRPDAYGALAQMHMTSFRSPRVNASVWALLASVCTRLSALERSDVLRCKSDTDTLESATVLTPEIMMSASLDNWMELGARPVHVQCLEDAADNDRTYALHVRLQDILTCALFIYGASEPQRSYIRFDMDSGVFTAVASESEEPEFVDSPSVTPAPTVPQINAEMEAEAERRLARLAMRPEIEQRTCVRVRPSVLVPDTNVFIDHCEAIDAICGSGDIIILVPLIVLNELRGLSRGGIGSEEETRVKAQAALRMIQKRMSAPSSNNMWAVTRRGARTRLFNVVEECEEYEQNDDRILETAANVISDRDATQERMEAGTLVIDRDVVLLTHDRILQLKATTHERFVPVAEVQPLMNWLHLTVTS